MSNSILENIKKHNFLRAIVTGALMLFAQNGFAQQIGTFSSDYVPGGVWFQSIYDSMSPSPTMDRYAKPCTVFERGKDIPIIYAMLKLPSSITNIPRSCKFYVEVSTPVGVYKMANGYDVSTTTYGSGSTSRGGVAYFYMLLHQLAGLPPGTYTAKVTCSASGYTSATQTAQFRVVSSGISLAQGLGTTDGSCVSAVNNGYLSLSGSNDWFAVDYYLLITSSKGQTCLMSKTLGQGGVASLKGTAVRPLLCSYATAVSGGTLTLNMGSNRYTHANGQTYVAYFEKSENFEFTFTRDYSALELNSPTEHRALIDAFQVFPCAEVYFQCNGGSLSTTKIDAPWKLNYNAIYEYSGDSSQKFPESGPVPPPKKVVNGQTTTYTFDGWYYGSTKVTGSSTVPNGVNTITLVAKWKETTTGTPVVQNYTVRYSKNDGSGTTKSQTMQRDKTEYLLSGWSRTDYEFLGWATSSSATSARYQPGQAVCNLAAANSTITLYAVWKKIATPQPTITYSLTLHRNGGTATATLHTISAAKGSKVRLPTIESLGWGRSGYTFLGWSTDWSATTPEYSDGATITLSSIMDLYAIWKKIEPPPSTSNKYTATLNANGGSPATVTITLEYGSTQNNNIKDRMPTRPGYRLVSWMSEPNGGTPIYDENGACVYGTEYWDGKGRWIYKGSPVVYALWIGNDYVLTFDYNGGYQGDTCLNKVYTRIGITEGYDISRYNPIYSTLRDWYVFDGWWTSPTGGERVYTNAGYGQEGKYWNSSKEWIYQSSLKLYAHWKLKNGLYIIRYNKNDGSGMSCDIAYKYGVESRIYDSDKDLRWTRAGYIFKGWSLTPDGPVWKGNNAIVKTGIPAGKTQNVYAVWEKYVPDYKIKFVKNEGSGLVVSRTFKHGVSTPLTSLAALKWARQGYDFLGWATSTANARNGKVWKSDKAAVSAPVAAGETLTVYAIWKLKSGYYEVRYWKNDKPTAPGTDNWRTVAYPYGKGKVMPTVANGLNWTRDGYAFGGWATSRAKAETGIVWKTDAATISTAISAGKTLNVYAIWGFSYVFPVVHCYAPIPNGQLNSTELEPSSGYYCGLLEDDSGTYDLLVDDPAADESTGYVRLETEEGIFEGECQVIRLPEGWSVQLDGTLYLLPSAD